MMDRGAQTARAGGCMTGSADVIFAGGPVYTADRGGRRLVRATAADGRPATAVAVARGAIAAVGSESDDAGR
jgi:predicted amidohydrolase YtcJ